MSRYDRNAWENDEVIHLSCIISCHMKRILSLAWLWSFKTENSKWRRMMMTMMSEGGGFMCHFSWTIMFIAAHKNLNHWLIPSISKFMFSFGWLQCHLVHIIDHQYQKFILMVFAKTISFRMINLKSFLSWSRWEKSGWSLSRSQGWPNGYRYLFCKFYQNWKFEFEFRTRNLNWETNKA